jgi:PQQ-dependent dehydrogenase (s-GDH family)
MTKFKILGLFGLLCLKITGFSQGEPFSKRTVISGLNSPWEITYGPNDSIWVTENFDYLVKRINISNGAATTLLDLSSLRNFSLNDGGRWAQGGLMGMAIHPALFSTDPATRGAKPWVYLAYVYDRPTGQTCSTNANSSNACTFHTRIVRYDYNGNSLTNPVIILNNMPGSNDHNSGRLTIGPDLKLYYTIGDMGAGQFNNSARTNNAQNVDVLEGKILRLNTETDGDAGADAWVPDDNPFFNGTAISPKDYVFSMGHRNAQGIVWGNVNGGDILYSSEHGDKSNDEVNMISAGNNYGWNRVSGYCDGDYDGGTLGGFSPVDEEGFCSATATNKIPLKTLFTLTQSQTNALSTDNLTWPTVAPSSIEFYGSGRIPGWQNSLLIPCLKAGKVYRLKLNGSGTAVINIGSSDTTSYFRGQGRFRDLAISPDGLKIYVACDITGQTSGPSGGFNGGGTPPPNAGAILEYTYVGIILPIKEPVPGQNIYVNRQTKIFPNPATENFIVTVSSNTPKPYTVKMFTVSGVLIREISSSRTELSVPVDKLLPNMYLVQVYNAHGQLIRTEKLIKR